MKNKKVTYLLVPVVIAIWLYVFYTLFWNKDKTNIGTVPFTNSARQSKLMQIPLDTFSISAAYRDPFLDRNYVSERTTNIPTHVVKAVPVTIQATTAWPKIAYFGIIKNQTGNKQLALLQINGKQRRVQLNESIDEIQLITTTKDSVQVKFGKELKYVKR